MKAGALFLLVLAALLGGINTAEAHHVPSGMLPYVPNTPTIQTLKATKGEWTFCFNSRASGYPGFVSQARETNAAYTARLGIRWREIPGSYQTAQEALSAGCNIYHEMPDTHGCDGCAAWVFYTNAVCHIQYKWQLGYVSWRSTQGHEMGHCLGLTEGYDDVNFKSHIVTYGFWASPWNGPTVMDFGTASLYPPYGVWELTAADARISCTWLDPGKTFLTGCGFQPVQVFPFWDPATERWVFADGRSYHPTPTGCGEWFTAKNQRAFAQCDDSWNGRYTVVDNGGVWLKRGTPVFTFDEWWDTP